MGEFALKYERKERKDTSSEVLLKIRINCSTGRVKFAVEYVVKVAPLIEPATRTLHLLEYKLRLYAANRSARV